MTLMRHSSRPAVFGVGLVAAALALTACSSDPDPGSENPATDAPAVDGFDWRAFEGESIELVLNQHPWQQAIEPRLDEFEELTGITVNVTALPEDQMRQRIQIEMAAQSDAIDVFMTGALAEGRLFAANGWYEDLTPYLEDENRTSPDYDAADFPTEVINEHTIDDALIGLPIQVETAMLYYRTDVFEDLGLDVPETLEDLESAARTVSEAGEMYGFTARGRGASATSQFSAFLYASGAEWNTADGRAAFNTPEGIEAFEYYGRLLREYGPAGATNNSWQEVLPIFQQGDVAMFVDASTFAPQILDPNQSTVADEVGFAPVPGGAQQAFWGWDLAMSPFSEVKDAAWYFIQWATSPEVVAAVQMEDGVAGARDSVTDFPDTLPSQWVEAFAESRANSRSQHPTIEAVPEARDILGNVIVTAIEGGDVAAAAADAESKFDALG